MSWEDAWRLVGEASWVWSWVCSWLGVMATWLGDVGRFNWCVLPTWMELRGAATRGGKFLGSVVETQKLLVGSNRP